MLRYYKHYFKEKATENNQIAHTEAKPAYFFVRDKFNPDAFDKALKTAAKLPALLLEPYMWVGRDGNNRNYFKHLACRFNILQKVDVGREQSIDDAQVQCELIAEDIIAKMREEFEQGGTITVAPGDTSPLVFFKVNEVVIDPIGPININYYGVTVGFELKTPFKAVSNPANWS